MFHAMFHIEQGKSMAVARFQLVTVFWIADDVVSADIRW